MMLYSHSEIIPLVLLLPVALNIILPLGMLATYLLLRLIRWGLSPVLGTAAAKPGMAMAAGADSSAERGNAAFSHSVPARELQG